MKKHIIFALGLAVLGNLQLFGMNEQQLDILNKEQQKEFRALLASYRGTYILLEVFKAVGDSGNKAEVRLLRDLGELLNQYKQYHSNDPFVANAFHKLEKFKNRDVPALFQKISALKQDV